MAYTFCTPKMIISGEGALEQAGVEFARLGARALVVSDGMMQKLGNVARLEAVLQRQGVGYSVFAEVDQEPTDRVVMKGVELYRAEGCDFCIAIGGGSPIDAMKAIAMVAALGGKPSDHFGSPVQGDLPPMVAIPTTAGTGSEASNVTIISDLDTDVKMLILGPSLMPGLAVVDPVFTLTAPPTLTAHTGVDTLCHCIEAYISRRAQPLSDVFALSAAGRIFKYLPITYTTPDDVNARVQMSLAATEAGIAFTNSSVTVLHGMSRPIGALFHLPHGLVNALLAYKILSFSRQGAEKRLADIARHCGMAGEGASDSAAADALFERLAALLEQLGIGTLADYGVDRAEFEKQIPKMAADAEKSGSPANTLRQVSVEDMKALYRSLWAD